MKRITLLILFLLNGAGLLKSQDVFNRSIYYETLTSGDLTRINSQISILEKVNTKAAFKGALLMKKADLLSNKKDKLNMFKSGHRELEAAILSDSTNVEYRFLRLLIQENAPKLLNYHQHIQKDAAYLRLHYKKLNATTKKVVLDYCKSSKELKPEDFKHTGNG